MLKLSETPLHAVTSAQSMRTVVVRRNQKSTVSTLMRAIFRASNAYEMPLVRYSDSANSLLLVDENGCDDLNEDYIARLLDKYPRIASLRTHDNCCYLAGEVARLGLASEEELLLQGCGVISISFINHFCNYMILPDSTYLSLDFTLADKLDDFQILAIRAKTQEGLFEKLHNIYGGTWSLFHNEGMLD